MVVKLGLIKLLTKRFDICEELGNANATLQCPIVADEYAIEQTVDLPEEIPRGQSLTSPIRDGSRCVRMRLLICVCLCGMQPSSSWTSGRSLRPSSRWRASAS